MAKYFIEDTTLVGIADEVRELSDLSDTMTANEMVDNLSAINADVDVQAGLIEEIAAALEGKASGGGSSGGEIQTYTGTIYGLSGLGDIPDRILCYTDENFILQELVLTLGDEATISVLINTPIIALNRDSGFMPETVSANVRLLASNDGYVTVFHAAVPLSDGFELY